MSRMMATLWQPLANSPSRRAATRGPRRRPLSAVERLEQRVVMSADGGLARPELALTDVSAEEPAVVSSGGWGLAEYQFGVTETYGRSALCGTGEIREATNRLINDFVAQDKYVTPICHGVTVLAYARVSGVNPLGERPAADVGGRSAAPYRGAEPAAAADDVIVDGKIITAENYDSAAAVGKAVARAVKAAAAQSKSTPLPVLLVIPNQDFYYQDYADTRGSLEAAGLKVVVAAATETATPHSRSVVAARRLGVEPDVSLADVNAGDYSAIVFVGGWGG